MKSVKKTKITDFKLLSPQTKKRIAGLIEMKLTPQTIALFAQEYEDYDAEVRLEIVEFIGFLMEEEMGRFMTQVRAIPSTDESSVRRRQLEFEEKARNIRKIQDILIEPKVATKSNRPAPLSSKSESDNVRSKLAKVSKSQAENKIDRLIKEAEERERKNRKREADDEAKRQKELERLAKEREKAKAKPAKLAKLDKKVAKTENKSDKKADSDRSAREKASNEEFLRRQKELQQDKERQAKEYARREAEKEKLWMELYGKSRTESQKQREAAEEQHKQKPEGERDKTPKIRDLKITSYKLFDHTYEAEEITDPKNRVYLFWFNFRQKQRVGNLFNFVETLPLSKQKKLWKKRLKWLKRVSKISESANLTAEKEQKERAAVEAAAQAAAEKQAKLEAEKAAKDADTKAKEDAKQKEAEAKAKEAKKVEAKKEEK